MTAANIALFKAEVWEYYRAHKRDTLPWRISDNQNAFAYRVLVSEFMLQQTQVVRVIDKFNEWMQTFPTIEHVANARLLDVLALWSGLGYNRRAQYLHETCKAIVAGNHGTIPREPTELIRLPGIGPNTAAAIVVYSYNIPLTFIETNIRTVYIHHFFADSASVADDSILELVQQTVDNKNPREWYWALMDYGSYLKKQNGNASRKSKHYTKQSSFIGSRRQLRGAILKQLLLSPQTMQQLNQKNNNDSRLTEVLETLQREHMIIKTGAQYHITNQ